MLLGLIIKVYCNDCPRDEVTWGITDTKASGDTMGNVMADMLTLASLQTCSY